MYILTVFKFAGVFFLLELVFADQVLSEKSAKFKPHETKVLQRNSWLCDTIWCKRKPKSNFDLSSDYTEKKRNYEVETTCSVLPLCLA